MTLGKPWTCSTFRNSKVSISNPKLASTRSSTRSETFARSIMAGKVLGHSKKVRRRFLLDTTVTGPRTSTRLCLLNFFTSDCGPAASGRGSGEGGSEHCADLD